MISSLLKLFHFVTTSFNNIPNKTHEESLNSTLSLFADISFSEQILVPCPA